MTKVLKVETFLEKFNKSQTNEAAFYTNQALEPRGDTQGGPEENSEVGANDVGELELRAALEGDYNARIEENRKELETILAQERRLWIGAESERVAASVRAGLDEIEAKLSQSVEKILTPFVCQMVVTAILGDFQERVRALFGNRTSTVVEIRGPKDLSEIVAERLATSGIKTKAVADDSPELTVKINETELSTRIQEWLERVRRETIQ